jgi:hypothetical protein
MVEFQRAECTKMPARSRGAQQPARAGQQGQRTWQSKGGSVAASGVDYSGMPLLGAALILATWYEATAARFVELAASLFVLEGAVASVTHRH